MGVSRDQDTAMLKGQSGDPDIITRNWPSLRVQVDIDFGVTPGSLRGHVENRDGWLPEEQLQQALVFLSSAPAAKAAVQFAKHDCGNKNLRYLAEEFENTGSPCIKPE